MKTVILKSVSCLKQGFLVHREPEAGGEAGWGAGSDFFRSAVGQVVFLFCPFHHISKLPGKPMLGHGV